MLFVKPKAEVGACCPTSAVFGAPNFFLRVEYFFNPILKQDSKNDLAVFYIIKYFKNFEFCLN